MAQLDFPTAPSVGDTYEENNVTYTWNGVFWAANNAELLSDKFVEIAGDNMDGNLTLGGDQITLNATNGNVFTEGAIATTRFNVTAQLASEETINGETKQFGLSIKNGADIYRAALDYSGNLALGDDAWITPNIYLKGDDGSSRFGGQMRVTVGEYTSLSDTTYTSQLRLGKAGGGVINGPKVDFQVGRYKADTSTDEYSSLKMTVADTSNPATSSDFIFNGDGSSKFANDVETAGVFIADRTTSDATTFAGRLNGSTTTQLYASGAATFGSPMKIAPDAGGNIQIYKPKTSENSSGIQLTANQYASTVLIQNKGATPDTSDAIGVYKSTSKVWHVNSWGATTLRSIQINLEPDDESNYEMQTETYYETVYIDLPASGVGTADLKDKSSRKSKEVKRTREVNTYIGPVLNVKEELQSLRSRAIQQDQTIALMTNALKSLGIDTAAFPAPEEVAPKSKRAKK